LSVEACVVGASDMNPKVGCLSFFTEVPWKRELR